MSPFTLRWALLAMLTGVALPAVHAQAVSVRPGAPGEPSRLITHDPASTPTTPYVEADVRFMQGMIHHHSQALDMAVLARTRTTNRALRMLAERIDVSQGDEIRWMQRWLRERGHEAPEVPGTPPDVAASPTGHGGHPAGHAAPHAAEHAAPPDAHPEPPTGDQAMDHGTHGMGHALMPGMLTPEEMNLLADATGPAFDRLFLQYMIRHHEGGLIMVADLLAQDGGGQAPEVYRFATDIDADQRADIRRMLAMLDAPRLPTILRHHQ